MMELTVTQTTAVAANGKPGAETGKAEGKSGEFEALMQKLGLTEKAAEDLAGNTDLLALLASLSGGLSPLALAQLAQGEATTAQEEGLTIPLMLGGQKLALDLQKLPLTNEQLANLLQTFGASPALVSVLMESPQGKPAATLKGHPELLANLSQTFSQALAQTAEPGVNLPDEQLAVLMQTVKAALETNATAVQKANGQQNLLNKMHVSLTSHVLQAVSVKEEAAQPEQTTVPVTNLQHLTPGTTRPATVTATNASFTMRADQLRAELPGLLVKRAALIEAPGRQEFRIVLEPQGLGELQLRVQKAQNGQVSVLIAAESLAAKAMIDAGLASLRVQLQSQGIQFDRIEVTHGSQEANSGLPQDRGSNQNQHGQAGSDGSDRQAGQDTFSLEAELAEQEEALAADSTGIDVTA